ncbi:hypothetical protein IJZ97_01385 [bacterium]|nr:hypothetical protein [bacterium]
MKISGIQSYNVFTGTKEKTTQHKNAPVYLIPVAVVTLLAGNDSCSKLDRLEQDEFVKQDSLEVLNLEPEEPPFEILVDTTYNEIHHEITL